jgi:S1-C subfamily serine protease
MARMGGGGGHGAALGVVPDYGSTDAPVSGVRISGTSEGSPAEHAGLKAGDVITGFGDMKIENLEDLSEAIAKHKPGDKVHLTLLRSGKPVETDATLGERKG